MPKWERVVSILCILYVISYGIFFFRMVWTDSAFANPLVLPLHLLGMVLCFTLLALVLHDIYKRPFPDPNAKVTWALLVVFANLFAIPIYLWKYGFRTRNPVTGTVREPAA